MLFDLKNDLFEKNSIKRNKQKLARYLIKKLDEFNSLSTSVQSFMTPTEASILHPLPKVIGSVPE